MQYYKHSFNTTTQLLHEIAQCLHITYKTTEARAAADVAFRDINASIQLGLLYLLIRKSRCQSSTFPIEIRFYCYE